jgi:RecB family exonuclease
MAPANSKPNTLTLTSTGRLARHLRHRHRLENLSAGRNAWEPLRVLHLNAWFEERWASSWPEELPAPGLLRIATWRNLAVRIPPPEPLIPDIALHKLLDENYGIMIRHRLNPGTGDASTPLVAWRQEISAAFKGSLAERGYFHPSELPLRITRTLTTDGVDLPGEIRLLGFESPAPAEVELFEALRKRTTLIVEVNRKWKPECLEALRLPTPEQEVLYLLERLVEDAQALPLHRIGVVAPDLDEYAPLLERGLRDIAGATPPGDSSFFNLTLGQPLLDFPLVKAGLLPLRFVAEGEKRELFLALLLNPFYGHWKGVRHEIARTDRTWREKAAESGLSQFLTIAKKAHPDLHGKILRDGASRLLAFCRQPFSETKTVGAWIASLESLWSALSFPVLSGEQDQIAWRHLNETLADLRAHLSAVRMDGFEFLSWLRHMLRETPSREGASEEAGIQFLGLIESRGLDFDRLYVLGMTDRSLPQPVRPLPFLDGRERMAVLGGTPESQYAFAERAYSHLVSLAPSITLLRPEQKDSEILLPSPFWPRQDEVRSVNIWSEPGRAWIRAGWLKSAFEGCKVYHERSEGPLAGHRPVPGPHLHAVKPQAKDPGGLPADQPLLPVGLSVADVQAALSCPFRYFTEILLGIKPLEEAGPAVTPLERGKRLHRVLRSFTTRLREQKLDFRTDRKKLLAILKICVDEALEDVGGKPEWDIERRLWLGEESGGGEKPPGILSAWLEAEMEHFSEGWKILGEELRFQKLKCKDWSFEVRGRMDRMDVHDSKGIIVWDYKTGTPPRSKEVLEQFKEAQLPLYLLALREGKLSSTAPAGDRGLSAGYIRLKSAGRISMAPLGAKGFSWQECLDRWERTIAALGIILRSNDFPAKPYPVSAPGVESDCLSCAFVTLCEKGLTGEWRTREEDEDEE